MEDTNSQQRSAAASLFHVLPWIILTVGVALFFVSYRSDAQSEEDEGDFARAVALDWLENSITRELERQSDLLLSVAGLFEASEIVDRSGFGAFVAESEALNRTPELQAVEWAPLVLTEELDAFVATVRSQETVDGQLLSDFDVRPSEDSSYHVIVTYVEPLDGNEAALGLDLTAEDARHEAVQRARASGEVAATRPVVLVEDATTTTGVLLVQPVEGEGRIGSDRFDGVVVSVFDVDRLIGNRVQATTPFVLTDLGTTDGVEDSNTVVHRTDADTAASQDVRGFEFAGRRWSISLGEGAIESASAWSLLLRSLSTLVAAMATALVVYTLSRHNERAESRARELTAEVHEKNEELVRSNEWLESFTRVASHDLRSPLRAVNSLVGFIREDHPDLDEDAIFNLNRIEQRVDRMNTLIDDLLTLARVSDASEKPTTVEFESLVQEVLGLVDMPEGFSVETNFSGPESGELAAVQFKTCVQNLVDNAIKHHDREDGAVTIDVLCGSSVVRVDVTDDGPGIPEQYLASIFEPFRRLKPDDVTPGSGIGLTTILRTAETNRGDVSVASVEGEGTTFTLRWPLGERKSTRSSNPESRTKID